MKPLKVNPKFRSNMWHPNKKVWYQHNDDENGEAEIEIRDKGDRFEMSKKYPTFEHGYVEEKISGRKDILKKLLKRRREI